MYNIFILWYIFKTTNVFSNLLNHFKAPLISIKHINAQKLSKPSFLKRNEFYSFWLYMDY
jgi:hypothetical protein